MKYPGTMISFAFLRSRRRRLSKRREGVRA
jgi:hypothetical protein